jgi:hypothetical protein
LVVELGAHFEVSRSVMSFFKKKKIVTRTLAIDSGQLNLVAYERLIALFETSVDVLPTNGVRSCDSWDTQHHYAANTHNLMSS